MFDLLLENYKTKCILSKISRPDSAEGIGLRTDTVEGTTFKREWEVGEVFLMVAPPLVSGNIRSVNTSQIQNMVLISDGYRFTTLSGSVYEVTFP